MANHKDHNVQRQCIVKKSQCIVKKSQRIVKKSKRIVKKSQRVAKMSQSITVWTNPNTGFLQRIVKIKLTTRCEILATRCDFSQRVGAYCSNVLWTSQLLTPCCEMSTTRVVRCTQRVVRRLATLCELIFSNALQIPCVLIWLVNTARHC